MIIKVKQICDDDFCRPRIKDVETGRIYVDVSMGRHEGTYNIPGEWYVASPNYGEPEFPVKTDTEFVLVK